MNEKDLRQYWRTPDDLYALLDWEVGGFNIDVAASQDNAKCDFYIREDEDGLLVRWFLFGGTTSKAWCNPPYRNPKPWLVKAHEETRRTTGSLCYILLNHDASTEWYKYATLHAAEIRVMTGARVQFESPDPSINKSSNSKGQCLIVFRNTLAPCHVWHWDWKADIEAFKRGDLNNG